jgi:very-short-patch-repair endonuclease
VSNPNRSRSRIRGASESHIARSKQLRQEATPAEDVLWQALRNRRLADLKFRRQVALGPYFLDFVCSEKRLIVEVDGDVHDEQIDYDAARTEHLEQYGYRVLRFRNDEVLDDLDTVLDTIRDTALTPSPSPKMKVDIING